MPPSTATHGLCLCRRYLATMSSSCNLRSVACYYLCPVTARPLTSNRKQAYSCTEEVFDVLKVGAQKGSIAHNALTSPLVIRLSLQVVSATSPSDRMGLRSVHHAPESEEWRAPEFPARSKSFHATLCDLNLLDGVGSAAMELI